MHTIVTKLNFANKFGEKTSLVMCFSDSLNYANPI